MFAPVHQSDHDDFGHIRYKIGHFFWLDFLLFLLMTHSQYLLPALPDLLKSHRLSYKKFLHNGMNEEFDLLSAKTELNEEEIFYEGLKLSYVDEISPSQVESLDYIYHPEEKIFLIPKRTLEDSLRGRQSHSFHLFVPFEVKILPFEDELDSTQRVPNITFGAARRTSPEDPIFGPGRSSQSKDTLKSAEGEFDIHQSPEVFFRGGSGEPLSEKKKEFYQKALQFFFQQEKIQALSLTQRFLLLRWFCEKLQYLDPPSVSVLPHHFSDETKTKLFQIYQRIISRFEKATKRHFFLKTKKSETVSQPTGPMVRLAPSNKHQLKSEVNTKSAQKLQNPKRVKFFEKTFRWARLLSALKSILTQKHFLDAQNLSKANVSYPPFPEIPSFIQPNSTGFGVTSALNLPSSRLMVGSRERGVRKVGPSVVLDQQSNFTGSAVWKKFSQTPEKISASSDESWSKNDDLVGSDIENEFYFEEARVSRKKIRKTKEFKTKNSAERIQPNSVGKTLPSNNLAKFGENEKLFELFHVPGFNFKTCGLTNARIPQRKEEIRQSFKIDHEKRELPQNKINPISTQLYGGTENSPVNKSDKTKRYFRFGEVVAAGATGISTTKKLAFLRRIVQTIPMRNKKKKLTEIFVTNSPPIGDNLGLRLWQLSAQQKKKRVRKQNHVQTSSGKPFFLFQKRMYSRRTGAIFSGCSPERVNKKLHATRLFKHFKKITSFGNSKQNKTCDTNTPVKKISNSVLALSVGSIDEKIRVAEGPFNFLSLPQNELGSLWKTLPRFQGKLLFQPYQLQKLAYRERNMLILHSDQVTRSLGPTGAAESGSRSMTEGWTRSAGSTEGEVGPEKEMVGSKFNRFHVKRKERYTLHWAKNFKNRERVAWKIEKNSHRLKLLPGLEFWPHSHSKKKLEEYWETILELRKEKLPSKLLVSAPTGKIIFVKSEKASQPKPLNSDFELSDPTRPKVQASLEGAAFSGCDFLMATSVAPEGGLEVGAEMQPILSAAYQPINPISKAVNINPLCEFGKAKGPKGLKRLCTKTRGNGAAVRVEGAFDSENESLWILELVNLEFFMKKMLTYSPETLEFCWKNRFRFVWNELSVDGFRERKNLPKVCSEIRKLLSPLYELLFRELHAPQKFFVSGQVGKKEWPIHKDGSKSYFALLNLGKMPFMTKQGNFLINGSARVLVSQIAKCPNFYTKMKIDSRGRPRYWTEFVSSFKNAGEWIQFHIDVENKMFFSLGTKRKYSIFIFLGALGISPAEIPDVIEHWDFLKQSIHKEEILSDKNQNFLTYLVEPLEVREARILFHDSQNYSFYPGSEKTDEELQKFFEDMFYNPARYFLGHAGREALNQRRRFSGTPSRSRALEKEDFLAAINSLIEVRLGLAPPDDIDHLKYRRVRLPGELLQNEFHLALDEIFTLDFNKFREGPLPGDALDPPAQEQRRTIFSTLQELEQKIFEKGRPFSVSKTVGIQSTYQVTPLEKRMRNFFHTGQLSQYMDQTNPLAEITHKRRLTSLGPDGLPKQVGVAVRELHPSHFGRICPIETPEGLNAGLVASLSNQAQIGSNHTLLAPYYWVKDQTREFPQKIFNNEISTNEMSGHRPSTGSRADFIGCFSKYPPVLPEIIFLSASAEDSVYICSEDYWFSSKYKNFETVQGSTDTLLAASEVTFIPEEKTGSTPTERGSLENTHDIVDWLSETNSTQGWTAGSTGGWTAGQVGSAPHVHRVSEWAKVDSKNSLVKFQTVFPARYQQEFFTVTKSQIDFFGISPTQMISVGTSLIPFLEHDDANRALMGSNMQRQALPLLVLERPIVGTGSEKGVAQSSNAILLSEFSGQVSFVDGRKIVVDSFPKTITSFPETSKTKNSRLLLGSVQNAGRQGSTPSLALNDRSAAAAESGSSPEYHMLPGSNVQSGQIDQRSVLLGQEKEPISGAAAEEERDDLSFSGHRNLFGKFQNRTEDAKIKTIRRIFTVKMKIGQLARRPFTRPLMRLTAPSIIFASKLGQVMGEADRVALASKSTKLEKFGGPNIPEQVRIGIEGRQEPLKVAQHNATQSYVIVKTFPIAEEEYEKSRNLLRREFIKKYKENQQKKAFSTDFYMGERWKKTGEIFESLETKVGLDHDSPFYRTQTARDFLGLRLPKLLPTSMPISSAAVGESLFDSEEVKRVRGKNSTFSFENEKALKGASFSATERPLDFTSTGGQIGSGQGGPDVRFEAQQSHSESLQGISPETDMTLDPANSAHQRLKVAQAAAESGSVSNNLSGGQILKKKFLRSPLFPRKQGRIFFEPTPQMIFKNILSKNSKKREILRRALIGQSFLKMKARSQYDPKKGSSSAGKMSQDILGKDSSTQPLKEPGGKMPTFGHDRDFSGALSMRVLKGRQRDTLSGKPTGSTFKNQKVSWSVSMKKVTPYTQVTYNIHRYWRTNQNTLRRQSPAVKAGDWVAAGDLLADSSATRRGELCVGQNILVGYVPWEGYNFEDAIVVNERLVEEDIYTSILIDRYEMEASIDTGEKITRKIPDIKPHLVKNLDSRGIICVGTWVEEDDILVGKILPVTTELQGYSKLLADIYQIAPPVAKDVSFRVPDRVSGRILECSVTERIVRTVDAKGNTKSFSTPWKVTLYLVEKRRMKLGDKMSGRHGNKGIVSIILPPQDMPFLPDGTPLDVALNPLGVPSRMNVGQLLESLLGLAGYHLHQKYRIPAFDEMYGEDFSRRIVYDKLLEAAHKTQKPWLFNPNFPGKMMLRDGRTGEYFHQPVLVGYPYMLKLIHMVDDKMHARATGPYTMVTQQPLKGRANRGGQRIGEMEVWAVEAFAASYALQELLTLKSDDLTGRNHFLMSFLKRKKRTVGGIPDAFRVLMHELQSLCFHVHYTEDYRLTYPGLLESSKIPETPIPGTYGRG